MKLSEASEILDDRIDEFMTLLQDQTGLEYSAFGSAAHQSTTEVIAVGRICSDAAEGKLNAASVLLESSRRMGSGLRAPLNLSKLNGAYSFFPGQIVALRGINSSGKEFVVSEVLDLPLLPSAASTPDALAAHRERLRGGGRSMDIDSDTDPAPLNILVAAGPYTADDNLDFEPLHQLCSVAADTLADVLVLCGPFIDAEHPLIATGDFDLPDEAAAAIAASADPEAVTMATVFKYLVAPAINSVAAANPHVTILVVPSVRDAVARHVAWPQEPFSRKEVGLAPRVAHVVGNPMTLLVNEAVVGVSTQDVLFELRHEELVGSAAAFRSDLLARLSRYIIDQRHYFPLFPPVDRSKLPKTGVQDGGGIPPGAMLDTSYLKLGEMLNTRPDVLILPSSLPPFVKVSCCPALAVHPDPRRVHADCVPRSSRAFLSSIPAICPRDGPLEHMHG